ncbi:uncharacterized protein BXZ73DRAFT_9130, partial [Epithele typhae]|uniref:uncharacterized protein n=1 Tax=Epithele typhae TaxID=378194 RepID=UPI0020082377
MARFCSLCHKSYPTPRSFACHRRRTHRHPCPPLVESAIHYHPFLNGIFHPDGAPPPPRPDAVNWGPFDGCSAFEMAEWVFDVSHESQDSYSQLHQLLRAQLVHDGLEDYNPFLTIDNIPYGEASWSTFTLRYNGDTTPGSPSWKHQEYAFHLCNTREVAEYIVGNPEFKNSFDYVPFEEYMGANRDCRRVSNLMSGQWASDKADIIAQDPQTHGSMLVPIVMGADKTTVSIATGNQAFHPVYMSVGNLHNSVRRAHGKGLVPVAFLPIPKAAHEPEDDEEFRVFKKKLYHACLAALLEPLRDGMIIPQALWCPDGHFRLVIFEIGLFIADYPEQVYLSGVVYGWCPICIAIPEGKFHRDNPRTREGDDALRQARSANELWDLYGINDNVRPFTTYLPRADIHELLTPDLLHQLIKGTFKDHLVDWLIKYIKMNEPNDKVAKQHLDDIDWRLAAVPLFPGLHQFPQGMSFTQWTGDDSKALMKVIVLAIVGYVPPEMVKCVVALLDFCYLARRPSHDKYTIHAMSALLKRFHQLRTVFEEEGIRPDGFVLPRQHA